MFLINWFYGILSSLGLYHKSGKILFLGLDNAGKTTLLHMLKSDKLGTYQPTQHPNVEELTMGSINFTTIDLGGHLIARRLWLEYLQDDVSAIVFLIDSSDQERFRESKQELDRLLTDDQIGKRPFLVLGNKIDKQGAVSEMYLKGALGLDGLTTGKQGGPTNNRPIEIFMCSIRNQMGFREGFQWLSQYVQ
ncbi:GTP-binding protein SAR1 [Acrasis kona]|uniref:GTP-binding protein SAR1 n=1 Tax=Acrasis kona TaxID=1008807 RepID=A0AAW2Z573_9EUKA